MNNQPNPLLLPGLVSKLDLFANEPERDATADPVYVGDPQADTPKPRKNNVAVYGRKFQR